MARPGMAPRDDSSSTHTAKGSATRAGFVAMVIITNIGSSRKSNLWPQVIRNKRKRKKSWARDYDRMVIHVHPSVGGRVMGGRTSSTRFVAVLTLVLTFQSASNHPRLCVPVLYLQALESYGGSGTPLEGSAAGGVDHRDAVTRPTVPCKSPSMPGELHVSLYPAFHSLERGVTFHFSSHQRLERRTVYFLLSRDT